MSQKSVPEFFAFYPYEFLSDENVLAMSLEQVGAYLLLIISQWINGSIPADVPMLARILKKTPEEMESLWAGVAPCFQSHPELCGRLIQPRVETERKNAIEAITKSVNRQAEYRERKRKEAERLRLSQSCNNNVTQQNSDMTKPSNLVLSNIYKEEPRREEGAEWKKFSTLYPAHRFDEDLTFQVWISRDDDERIVSGLHAWLASDDWQKDNGKYVPYSSKFIADGKYKRPPSPKPAIPTQSAGRAVTRPEDLIR